MSKKSRNKIGAMARKVAELEDGRVRKGLLCIDGNWRKLNDGDATVSETFVGGSCNKILTFNGGTYGGDTPVLDIEY